MVDRDAEERRPLNAWAVERLAHRIIRQAAADAMAYARHGKTGDNIALCWLWDVGKPWYKALGGDERVIANVCEEIEIAAYAAREGKPIKSGPITQKLYRSWQKMRT